MALSPRGIDHIVLTCPDVERSLAWWQRVFDAEPVRVDDWRRGEVPFPSLRLSATSIVDFLAGERTGENWNHVAVAVEPVDLEAAAAGLGLDVVMEPRPLYGAQGVGTGMYVRDPDGNVVELRVYSDSGP